MAAAAGQDAEGCPNDGRKMMDTLMASLREEAWHLWRTGGGDSLLEGGAGGTTTVEHDTHSEAFTTKLIAESLHEMLESHLSSRGVGAPQRAPPPRQVARPQSGAPQAARPQAAAPQARQAVAEAPLDEEPVSCEVPAVAEAPRVRTAEEWREVRKKDSPDEADDGGQKALAHAQKVQRRLVEENMRSGKPQNVLVTTKDHCSETRSWDVPVFAGWPDDVESASLYTNLYAHQPPLNLRCVVDDFASPEECRNICGYCVRGMHCMFRRGGQTSLAVSRELLARRMDADGAALICSMVERARQRIIQDFGLSERAALEAEPVLYESGALLTRLCARWEHDMWEISGEDDHPYWNAHVDKANVASYDYGALLYLNTQGVNYEGGDFAFIDADEDCLVQPKAGRFLVFTAGPENLHQVRRLTKGTRFVLAMWYTLSKQHARKEE